MGEVDGRVVGMGWREEREEEKWYNFIKWILVISVGNFIMVNSSK